MRVLTRLGFLCRRMDEVRSDAELRLKNFAESTEVTERDRLSEITSTIKVLHTALAGISDRVGA